MNIQRLREITDRYAHLTIAVLGDFCLDRYLEIDPQIPEISTETGLPVHNVINVRAQPGGAGTVFNNLAALGIGKLIPISFTGDDGEGLELTRALRNMPNVNMDAFFQTPLRRTFTYCKPLVINYPDPPKELNRLDSKNWTPTPPEVEDQLIANLHSWIDRIDALVLMEQAENPEAGVFTQRMRETIIQLAARHPKLCIFADSRRSLRNFPSAIWKMNRVELGQLLGTAPPHDLAAAKAATLKLAHDHGRRVYVSLAEDGLIAANPSGEIFHQNSLPLRGEIDIVGAGDSVSANLVAAMVAGASLAESVEIANAAASITIHKLGTTGTASIAEITALLDN